MATQHGNLMRFGTTSSHLRIRSEPSQMLRRPVAYALPSVRPMPTKRFVDMNVSNAAILLPFWTSFKSFRVRRIAL